MKAEELSPTVSGHTVELIHLSDVDDIYGFQDNCLVLTHSHRGSSIAFEYSDCDVLLKVREEYL